MWRLYPETTTGWLGPSLGLRGEKRRLLDFFLGLFHTCIQQLQGLKNNRFTESGWKINKNILLLLNDDFQGVFLVLIESFKPKNLADFTESSVHIICHSCWSLISWLARIPRAEQRRLMLRMRFKEQQSSQKTIPKLVRTRERSTASLAPLQVVVY